MNLQLNDSTKAKLRGLLGTASDKLRVAGPPVIRWLMAHKALVVIAVLILYIILPRNSSPDIRGPSFVEPVVVARNSGPSTTQSATQPTTNPSAQSVTSQFAGEVPLYAPGVEGADPQWSLPAELSGADIQNFIQQVNNLANQYNAANDLEDRYNKTLSILTNDKTFVLFWTRAIGPGFHDTNLPLDWYQIVKDKQTGVLAQAEEAAEFIFKKAATDALLTRFRNIQTRLIGGKLLIGDRLFIKTFKAYEDDRFSRFQKLTPLAEGVAKRAETEFRKELEPPRQNSGGEN